MLVEVDLVHLEALHCYEGHFMIQVKIGEWEYFVLRLLLVMSWVCRIFGVEDLFQEFFEDQ